MIDSTATYFAHLKNCYVIIEKGPCKECTQCGEDFFSSDVDVIEHIDEILSALIKTTSKVCIMEYRSAA